MFITNMPSQKVISLFFFITFLYFANTQAQSTYTTTNCSTNTFTTNSTFQSALTSLLSSLASNNTKNNDFFNTTINYGSGNNVYGLFMCRGDVNLTTCHQCVIDATTRIRSDCNISKEAVIWYEECMVRYSDRYFFSSDDTSPNFCGANSNGVANNQTGFMNLLSTTMNTAADEAAKPALGLKKYATQEASLQFQTMYCLVQCTPDLSPEGCRSCLRSAITQLLNCSRNSIGGRVLYPSCNLRYELFIFYNSTGQPRSSPPSVIIQATNEGKVKLFLYIILFLYFYFC